MIVVQVELWPLGAGEQRKIIASAVIENRGLDDSGGYRYFAELHNKGEPTLQIPAREHSVEISGHDRRQSVWRLIHHVLSAATTEVASQKAAPALVDSPNESRAVEPPSSSGTYELDLLAAAWGWRQEEVAVVLRVDADRLRAWRNHELFIDAASMTRIALLKRVHVAMWRVLAPGSYARWWRRSGPFGGRRPIEVALEDEDGLEKIEMACASAIW